MINYDVKLIHMNVAKEYIIKNHYTQGCHNAPSPCYGLFEGEGLIGVLMFAQPCSENVRGSIWGKEYKNRVIELHRLHIQDTTPKNTESWFISRCIDRLLVDKPEIRGIISFADTTEGHSGVIYQATNFYFLGKTSKATFYLDKTGRLRHPRQNSINISKEDALKMGWQAVKRAAKNRYLYIFAPSKSERKHLVRSCRYDVQNFVWCEECGTKSPKGSFKKVCSKCSEKIKKEKVLVA